jgi:hypothetical protein
MEDARDCLLSVLGPRDGRLHRCLALVESALTDFWHPGDEDAPAALADSVPDEVVHLDAPRPRAG